MLIAMLNFHKYHICHHSDSDFRNQLCTYAQLGFAGECSTTQLWRCLGKNIPSHRIHVLRVYLHFGTKLMGQMQVDIFTSPMDTLKIFHAPKNRVRMSVSTRPSTFRDLSATKRKSNTERIQKFYIHTVPVYLKFPEQSSNSMRTVSTSCGANIKKWRVKGVILRGVKSHYMNLTCHILV